MAHMYGYGMLATLITTTADTTVSATQCVVSGMVTAGAAAAVTLKIFNGSTAAANEVARISAPANSTEHIEHPIRCDNGCFAQLSAATGAGFVYIH